MRINHFLFIFTLLVLSACESPSDLAYNDKNQENFFLATIPFGEIIEFTPSHNLIIVADSNYVLTVLKKFADKNTYNLKSKRKRYSIEVTLNADKFYDILIHKGQSYENKEPLNMISVLEFKDAKTPSKLFKEKLLDAFKQEQQQHDVHEHINAIYRTSLPINEVKEKFDHFFSQLYPKAIITSITRLNKQYTVYKIHRGIEGDLLKYDMIFYLLKSLSPNETEIQFHTGTQSEDNKDNFLTVPAKEKSAEVLKALVKKLNLPTAQ